MPKFKIALPASDDEFDVGALASRLNDAARYCTMAWALRLERRHNPEKNQRPFWLDNAVEYLNKLVEEGYLVISEDSADPVDALFERANVVALNQQREAVS